MVNLLVNDCGKKYRGKWVFRNLNFTIETEQHFAVTGKNGSGKSTLLKILAGYTKPSKGTVQWSLYQSTLPADKLFEQVYVVAPYLETIEEFTLSDLIRFQQKFKPFKDSLSLSKVVEVAGLTENKNKPLQFFSSGMKQRAMLTLAMLSSARLVLLDEPCANLDKDARLWYADLLDCYGKEKTVVIASNHNEEEYPEVDGIISL